MKETGLSRSTDAKKVKLVGDASHGKVAFIVNNLGAKTRSQIIGVLRNTLVDWVHSATATHMQKGLSSTKSMDEGHYGYKAPVFKVFDMELDKMYVHPEVMAIVAKMLTEAGYDTSEMEQQAQREKARVTPKKRNKKIPPGQMDLFS